MLHLLPHVADAAHELKPERDKLADELHKPVTLLKHTESLIRAARRWYCPKSILESGDLFMSALTLDAAD